MTLRPSIRTTVTTLAAAAVLVAGANVASYAATGHALLIGKANSGVGTTSLKNQGRGPALSLNSAKTSPPLTVNSKKLVKNLNAQMVGGLTASELGPTNLTYRIGHSNGVLSPDQHFFGVRTPPKGTYEVSVKGLISLGTGDTILCAVIDQRAFSSSMDVSLIYLLNEYGTSTSGATTIDTSGFAQLSGHHTLVTGCQTTGNTGTDTIIQPITFTFTKVKQTVKHAPPISIPKHAAARLALR